MSNIKMKSYRELVERNFENYSKLCRNIIQVSIVKTKSQINNYTYSITLIPPWQAKDRFTGFR